MGLAIQLIVWLLCLAVPGGVLAWRVLGRREGLSEVIQEAIGAAQEKTAGCARGQFNLCLNYGGRAEIVEGVKSMVAHRVDPTIIDENLVGASMWSAGIPDPDMIVRTGGEQRLSGFLLWSSAYSELKFVDTFWPDFSVEDLEACLQDFELRQRRFGA